MNSDFVPDPRTDDLAQFKAAQRRRMLEYIVLAMSMAVTIYLIVLLVQSPPYVGMPGDLAVRYVVSGLTLAGGACALMIGRRVSVDLAALLYLILVWLVLLTRGSPASYIEQGEEIWFAVIVIASGLLLRPWATFVFAAISAGALLLLAFPAEIPLIAAIGPSILLMVLALLAWIYAENLERGNRLLQQALAQVRQREQYNRKLFSVSPLPMGLIDVNSQRILDINEAVERTYGYSRDELVGLTAEEQHIRVLPMGEPPIPPQLLANHGAYSEEQQHHTKVGQKLDVVVSSDLVQLPGGPAVLCVVQDITARKRAEEQLRLMSQVVEDAPMAIALLDPGGVIVYVNRLFEELTGRTRQELIGQGWEVLAYEGPETGYPVQAIVEASASGQIWRGEMAASDASNSPRWYSLVVSPLVAVDAPRPYVLCIATDVTARHDAEAALQLLNAELEARVERRTSELQRANMELESSNRLKDQFLAMMSHELRTPLTGILGGADALNMGVYGSLNPKQENLVALIQDNGSHLLDVVNTLLDLSRIGSGEVQLQLQPTMVARICSESLRMVQVQAEQKDISISLNCQPYDLELELDQKRMRQILRELLSNAVKFTPEHGQVGIDVKADNEAQTAHITVWDTGIGIAPDIMPLLFKPFSQADSRLNRSYDGTGLGLALVQRLVELYGGSIEVSSALGKGSSFTIVLPFVQPVTQQRHDAPPDATVRRTYALDRLLSRRPLILLAEDSLTSVEIVLACLQPAGCDVHVAYNGEQAISMAVERRPDLILMDIQMPQLDGIEATRRIRAFSDPQLAKVPIVALTALAMYGDRERCLEAGMDDYVSKPFKSSTLLDTIQRLLTRNRVEHAPQDGEER